jgi:hypothetical protein
MKYQTKYLTLSFLLSAKQLTKLITATCCCLAMLSAQAGPFKNASQARVDYSKTNLAAKQSCQSMLSFTTVEFSVISAELINDTCRVTGVIPSEIRFEVNLPNAWNGRFMMTGNGGLAGQPLEDSEYQRQRDIVLAQGFANAYTDTGHDNRVEPGATFAYNNLHKLIDYGYRGIHLTNQTARVLIQHYYRKAPSYSYFMGCSNGGRQALMSAQRFPKDFDGILAGAPANDFTGLKFSQAHRMNALKDKPLNLKEVGVLAEHILARCDKLDGLEDKLISDPRTCDFDPLQHLPLCSAGTKDAADCFNTEELDALQAYYSPVILAGEEVYAGYPLGSELSGPSYNNQVASGWVPWVINEQGRPLMDILGADFFRYIVSVEDDPGYAWTSFDFKSEPSNLTQARAILDAVNPDLSAFAANGGKLLSYIGWADPDISPLTAISYHDQVNQQSHKPANDFYRLFLVPGMFHCSGGPGPTDFDAISPLIEWVEKGLKPERIEAQAMRVTEGVESIAFSRPLCPHPLRAVYQDGEPSATAYQKADNFACQ